MTMVCLANRFVSGKITYKKKPGVFIPAGKRARRRQQTPTVPGVDSEYQKAISNLVSNLRTRQRGVSKEAQNIAKGVTSMFTSDSVTQSIANLALGIAEARAREEDGNEFLGKAAVSTSGLHAAKSPSARTGEDWRDAMSMWRKQGIMNKKFRSDVKHPSRLDPSSGLTQMELKTVEENPASGASGPEAGEFAESSCAACLVCPGCCDNGWVPGCQGAVLLRNVTMAARISDALNYVIDPKDAAGIDQRLSSQYQSTLSSFLASREASEQRAAEAKLEDSEHYQEIMRDRKRRLLKRKIREQERKARLMPLESIAESSSAPLDDPWSQYYAFQGVLGNNPSDSKGKK
ncbi:hypothetical protein GUITHDRAFT_103332 [Guillardia theta CCMP2712]|uniref:Uncharacterized protein n=1 Tax=Guillardia theta (strain CCMP2712) TaxID=905079 RepID=L1JQ85_GUITC|nr:hypothetical protein GUITHDRAFT_103332 [Guillardia theta CCMP2712]EKX50741.1 hypothetical protein GUITHDRAFT_103332 [Guillardia theta CCMP2712]|eukprot:XP_005837721.1 hypothetical protein GUITHDRAFT_103332 [Guillardia theta CCMP2712]